MLASKEEIIKYSGNRNIQKLLNKGVLAPYDSEVHLVRVQEGHTLKVWKKVLATTNRLIYKTRVIKLELTPGTLINLGSNGLLRYLDQYKLRANQVISRGNGYSDYDSSFVYTNGVTLNPHRFSYDAKTCAGGIHFFLTREEARDYAL